MPRRNEAGGPAPREATAPEVTPPPRPVPVAPPRSGETTAPTRPTPVPPAPARTNPPPVRSIDALESLEEEMAKLLGRPIPPADR